jgi:hypothetical protein
MQVQELIELLEGCNPDDEVRVHWGDGSRNKILDTVYDGNIALIVVDPRVEEESAW